MNRNSLLLCFLVLSLFALAKSQQSLLRKQAPDFKAVAVQGEDFLDIQLKDYAGKWVVLFFYPFDFTFVCPTEIVAFSTRIDEFRNIDAEVLAVSTDSQFTHLAWIRTAKEDGGVGKLDFPLVADVSKDISRNYGVLVEDPEDPLYGAALRGLFIIDPEGKVRSLQVNDEAVGRNVDETLRTLQAFQYADSHAGEGCPANWTPGDSTIKANPNGAKDFFKVWGVEA
mmetsp:Transcript_2438/g.3456  ORF Transcript_2438/g.3456 Transcript_2438/m.3456 type:complete len:226 (-) Transcript_2438:338-1015(-)|eukprot:CAMPEP_0117761814 /NCGR_PEP_ID=MMETSP0947-20121206/17509_1 /TAXON_ID=44440 /ORGANISM="Chattonella subsalsa, Strain CCMP2191" /LENGTH=225 /DNA_ID=CAMNT_0005582887 /DNA_START=120 /DNA_END=797 /DNA_ORIENTATION=-